MDCLENDLITGQAVPLCDEDARFVAERPVADRLVPEREGDRPRPAAERVLDVSLDVSLDVPLDVSLDVPVDVAVLEAPVVLEVPDLGSFVLPRPERLAAVELDADVVPEDAVAADCSDCSLTEAASWDFARLERRDVRPVEPAVSRSARERRCDG